MDEVKGKMKGLIKKVNNPFSSSASSSFKGQGRVLGSAPSPAPGSASASAPTASSSAPRRAPTRPTPASNSPTPEPKHPTPDFHPFSPFLSSGARRPDPHFDCPVCARSFPSADHVAAHLDGCLAQPDPTAAPHGGSSAVVDRVGAYVSGNPAEGSVETLLRLLMNVAGEPENERFRRLRMGNPKINEAVGAAVGGVELLECVGFRLGEEDEEMWATMDVPSEDQISLIKGAVALLERWKLKESEPEPSTKPEVESSSTLGTEVSVEPKKVDRKVRVFFPVSESVAAKIDLPDSFYNISGEEIKREATQRRKKIEESQLLIPKSFKEKQALAGRKKYKATVIRVQFPDGVVLQGVFLPWETTTMLYEFVSSGLKEPSLEFELLQPAVPKLRTIPCFPKAGERSPTLEGIGLVPSALLRFKPIETESVVFTGLSNELLAASEPFTSMAAVS